MGAKKLNYSVCIDAVFRESKLSFVEAMSVIHRLGYKAYEFWSWKDKDIKRIKEVQKETGLKTAAFCTEFINPGDPEKQQEFLEGLKRSMETAHVLDKMDKIGLEGVAKELEEEGFAKESIDTYLAMFKEISSDIQGVRYCKEKLSGVLDEQIAADLETIISTVEAVKTADFKMAFDPTLVRGMSYYTGPIFEISMDEFGGSVGGGGRYDEMIGRFTGNQTPACGFSIGFERIVMLLLEKNYQVPNKAGKVAFLIEKNMPKDKLLDVFRQAEETK